MKTNCPFQLQKPTVYISTRDYPSDQGKHYEKSISSLWYFAF